MMQSGAWKALTVVVGFLLVGGCATIESYETLEQPTGSTLKTHINGKIFKVKRTSDLPNAFGKADLWGGGGKQGLYGASVFGPYRRWSANPTPHRCRDRIYRDIHEQIRRGQKHSHLPDHR